MENSFAEGRDEHTSPLILAEHLRAFSEGNEAFVQVLLWKPKEMGVATPITLGVLLLGDTEEESRSVQITSDQARTLGEALTRFADRADKAKREATA